MSLSMSTQVALLRKANGCIIQASIASNVLEISVRNPISEYSQAVEEKDVRHIAPFLTLEDILQLLREASNDAIRCQAGQTTLDLQLRIQVGHLLKTIVIAKLELVPNHMRDTEVDYDYLQLGLRVEGLRQELRDCAKRIQTVSSIRDQHQQRLSQLQRKHRVMVSQNHHWAHLAQGKKRTEELTSQNVKLKNRMRQLQDELEKINNTANACHPWQYE